MPGLHISFTKPRNIRLHLQTVILIKVMRFKIRHEQYIASELL